ncbi:MAG TPA: hypothetical protein VLC09_15795 [Polyangiaceae bacterium]|nr:hypothetical protein [Polyangiaceae bacterium]
MKKHLGRLVLGALLASTVVGCGAGPRYVATSTASKGHVKFLHLTADGSNRGIIKCDMAENGDLSNCRDVEIVLEEK